MSSSRLKATGLIFGTISLMAFVAVSALSVPSQDHLMAQMGAVQTSERAREMAQELYTIPPLGGFDDVDAYTVSQTLEVTIHCPQQVFFLSGIKDNLGAIHTARREMNELKERRQLTETAQQEGEDAIVAAMIEVEQLVDQLYESCATEESDTPANFPSSLLNFDEDGPELAVDERFLKDYLMRLEPRCSTDEQTLEKLFDLLRDYKSSLRGFRNLDQYGGIVYERELRTYKEQIIEELKRLQAPCDDTSSVQWDLTRIDQLQGEITLLKDSCPNKRQANLRRAEKRLQTIARHPEQEGAEGRLERLEKQVQRLKSSCEKAAQKEAKQLRAAAPETEESSSTAQGFSCETYISLLEGMRDERERRLAQTDSSRLSVQLRDIKRLLATGCGCLNFSESEQARLGSLLEDRAIQLGTINQVRESVQEKGKPSPAESKALADAERSFTAAEANLISSGEQAKVENCSLKQGDSIDSIPTLQDIPLKRRFDAQ